MNVSTVPGTTGIHAQRRGKIKTEEWSSRNKNRILKRADTESRNEWSEEAETGIGYMKEQQLHVD
jgi:hypothetical protein